MIILFDVKSSRYTDTDPSFKVESIKRQKQKTSAFLSVLKKEFN